jgi:hypothetical protein
MGTNNLLSINNVPYIKIKYSSETGTPTFPCRLFHKNGKATQCMIDSGATLSIIMYKLYMDIPANQKPKLNYLKEAHKISTGAGSLQVKGHIYTTIYFQGCALQFATIVVDTQIPGGLLLGKDVLDQLEGIHDFRNEHIYLLLSTLPLKIPEPITLAPRQKFNSIIQLKTDLFPLIDFPTIEGRSIVWIYPSDKAFHFRPVISNFCNNNTLLHFTNTSLWK